MNIFSTLYAVANTPVEVERLNRVRRIILYLSASKIKGYIQTLSIVSPQTSVTIFTQNK